MSQKKRITYDLGKNTVVQSGPSKKPQQTDLSDLTNMAAAGKKMEVRLRIASIVALVLVLLTMLFLILPDAKSRAIVFTALAALAGYAWYRIKKPYG